MILPVIDIEKDLGICVTVVYKHQCAGKRTFATPKPNPNHPKPSFLKKTRSKVPKTQKNRVCLQ